MERRYADVGVSLNVSTRDDGGDTVTGYAAVFYREGNTETEFSPLPGIAERIAPGAFDSVLAQGEDVRALFNHDPSNVLGRSVSGTLRLRVDDIGLRYEIDLPNTTGGRDLAESIKRGDVSGSSFGFTIAEGGQRWFRDNGVDIREVRNVARLQDVGPVTYPAYTATSTAIRSEYVKDCETAHKAWLDAESDDDAGESTAEDSISLELTQRWIDANRDD